MQSVQHFERQTGSLPTAFSGRELNACSCNMLCNQDIPDHLLRATRTFSPTRTFASKTTKPSKTRSKLYPITYVDKASRKIIILVHFQAD